MIVGETRFLSEEIDKGWDGRFENADLKWILHMAIKI